MRSVWKLILPATAAAVLAFPSVSLACPYHGASASIAAPQTVAQEPAQTPPATPPGNSG